MNPTGTQRYQLARLATQAERRNRPRSRLVLAGVLLLAGGVYATIGFVSKRGGERAFDLASQQRQRMHLSLVEIRSLEQVSDGGETQSLDPITAPISRLEEAATAAGLASPTPPQTRTDAAGPGFVRRLYPYSNVRADTALPLLNWIKRAQEAMPGLEVYSLNLRPTGQQGWTMGVTFARVEKDQ